MLNIKRQIQFVFEDIIAKRFEIGLCFIQIFIGMFLLSMILNTMLTYNQIENKMNTITKDRCIYLLKNKTTDEQLDIILNNKNKKKLVIELYDTIENDKNITYYTANSSLSFYGSESMHFDQTLLKNKRNSRCVNQLSVTPNFLEIFDIQGDYGIDMRDNIINYSEGNAIPILMGADYKRFFSMDEVIYDSSNNAYKIVGFLNKNSFYIAPSESRDIIYLDKFIISPQIIDDSSGIVDLFLAIINSNYITNNRNAIENVVDKSTELDLFDLSATDFTEQLQNIKNDYRDETSVYSCLLSVILVFSFIGITCNILQYISEYTKEFAIHMLSGASKFDIILRVTLQIFLMLFLAVIPVVIYNGIKLVSLIIILLAFFYAIIVLIYPIIILNKNSIIYIIRGND